MYPGKLVLIGSSTGGPGRIGTILERLDSGFDSALMIAQHMAPLFIQSFVNHLSTLTSLNVVLAQDGKAIHTGNIYVCSGECRLYENNGTVYIAQNKTSQSFYTPDIDALFISAASLSDIERMAIVLTGIGEDGAIGALKLYESGAQCWYENEQSAIVYGMPRKAKELNSDGKTGTIDQIAEAIMHFGASHVR